MEFHVLVAEDEADMLWLISKRVESLGHKVSRANDGEEAMRMILREDFDLIVTDINMPGATGLDILAEVKSRDSNAQVIIVTANATMENAIEALNRGAFNYLTKPFDHISVISNAVERALEFRRLQIENMRMAEAQRRRGDMLEDEVTHRLRQLSRQERAYRQLLAKLPQGILLASTNGLHMPRNPAAERWMALDESSRDHPIQQFLDSLKSADRRMARKMVRLDGRDVRLRAAWMAQTGEVVERLVVIEDLTEVSRSLAERIEPAVARLSQDLARLDLDQISDREVFLDMARQIRDLERAVRGDGGLLQDSDRGDQTPPPAA